MVHTQNSYYHYIDVEMLYVVRCVFKIEQKYYWSVNEWMCIVCSTGRVYVQFEESQRGYKIDY